MNEAENEAEPKGTPNMQIWSVGTRSTSFKGQAVLLSPFNHDHSHFLGFRKSPSAGPFSRSSRPREGQVSWRQCLRRPCTISGRWDQVSNLLDNGGQCK